MKLRRTPLLMLLSLACTSARGLPQRHRDPSTLKPLQRLRGGAGALSAAELDELFSRATRLRPELCDDTGGARLQGGVRSVVPAWSGRSTWLWRQWRGTVLEATWKRMVVMMLISCSVIGATRSTATGSAWPVWAAPPADHPVVARLKLVHHMWSYLLTITTFVTTFMLGHAYSFWLKSYAQARGVQGRLSDLGLLLSTHAAREAGSSIERPGECFAPGPYTPAARDLIALAARRLALTHVFFWAGVVRAAPGSDKFGVSFNMLLSRQCLEYLVGRGALTRTECAALLSLDPMPRSQLYACVLAWVTSDLAQALREGVIRGGAGAELAILQAATALRSACGSVHDALTARMPLAYVHFVQVLSDLLCVVAPFALYPNGGGCATVLSGVMVFFFSGILELCKSLLDPFGTRRVSNFNFEADIQVDVLLAETNGGLVSWPRRMLALHDTTTASLPMSVPLVSLPVDPAATSASP